MRLLPALALALAACQILVGVHERHLEEDAGMTAPDSAPPPPCSVDFANDPKNCGFCGHACDGCSDGLCPTTDIVSVIGPRAFAVDDTNIYVSARDGVQVYDKTGTLVRAFDAGPTSAVEAFESNAYWIKRPNDISVGFPDGGTAHVYGDNTSAADDLAVDVNGVYWVTNRDGLKRVDRDGTNLTALVPDDTLSTGKGRIVASNGSLYATNKYWGVIRMPADAGADASYETLVVRPVTTFDIQGLALVYTHPPLGSDGGETIVRIDLDGGTSENVGTTDVPATVAIRGKDVYADVSDGTILYLRDHVLAKNQIGSAGIAVDDQYVYWMTNVVGDAGMALGTIRRVRR